MHKKSTAERAADIGREHGKAAATWCFDDRTSDRTYQTVLQGITDGDPEIMDVFRTPDLSGEYAGDYGIKDLAADLGLDYDADLEESGLADVTTTYLDAVSGAFWAEIERICRQHTVPDDMRECDAQVLLDQIGPMNVMAISGGRVQVRTTGITLPVSAGYRVTVNLAANDTYIVRRVFTRSGREWVKGEMTGLYCENVGEVAYQASCFRNVSFGGDER